MMVESTPRACLRRDGLDVIDGRRLKARTDHQSQPPRPHRFHRHRRHHHHQGCQMTHRRRQLGNAERRSRRLRAYRRICRAGLRMPRDALVCFMLHTLVIGDLFCLYGVLKYYSNVEYPPHQPHAKIDFCVRPVSFFYQLHAFLRPHAKTDQTD